MKRFVWLILLLVMIQIVAATPIEFLREGTNGQAFREQFWKAQIFQIGTLGINATTNVTNVGVKIYRVGSPGVLTMDLVRTASNGDPADDLVIGTDTLNANLLTTDTGGEWRNFSINSSELINGSVGFGIILRLGGDVSNYVAWMLNNSANSYTGGINYQSEDGGASWIHPVTGDFEFEIYGTQDISVPTSTFSFSAIDIYTRSGLTNYSINITNSTHVLSNSTTTGGNLLFPIANGTQYNLTILSNDSGGYFNQTLNGLTLTLGGTRNFSMWQAFVTINATQVFSLESLSGINVTDGTVSNHTTTGAALLLLPANTDFVFRGNTSNHLNSTVVFNVEALTNTTFNMFFGTGTLTITAQEFFLGTSISEFAAVLTNNDLEVNTNQSTTTSSTSFLTIDGNYTLVVSATNYETTPFNLTISGSQNFTATLFPNNSIFIQTFDQITEALIAPLEMKFTLTSLTEPVQFNFSSTNGTLFERFFPPSEYFIQIQSTDGTTYPIHNFILTLGPGSHSSLNAFLLNSSLGTQTSFFVRDPVDALVEGATLLVQKQINNTFVTVGQSKTDFSGRTTFLLDTDVTYKIFISAENFNSKIITVQPFSPFTFTIYLSGQPQLSFIGLGQELEFAISPRGGVVSATTQNFSIVITSSSGSLSEATITAVIDGVSFSDTLSGSPGGGTVQITPNLENLSGQTFNLVYTITSSTQTLTLNETFMIGIITGNPSTLAGALKTAQLDLTPAMQQILAGLSAVIFAIVLATVGIPGMASGIGGIIVLIIFSAVGWIDPTLVGLITVTGILVYLAAGRSEGNR